MLAVIFSARLSILSEENPQTLAIAGFTGC